MHHDHAHRVAKAVAKKLALRGSNRNDDGVVLVTAVEALAFAAKHADDLEWQVSNAQGFANRVFIAKQIASDLFADHGDLRSRLYFGLIKGVARSDGPVAQCKVVGVGANDISVPVLRAINDLRAGLHDRCGGGNACYLA